MATEIIRARLSNRSPEVPERTLLQAVEALGRRQLPARIAESSPDERSRALILLGTAGMVGLTGTVMAVVSAAAGEGIAQVAVSGCVALLGAGTLLALRTSANVRRTATGFLVLGALLLAVAASIGGGLRSAAMPWFGTIPMVGALLVGRRFARGCAVAAVAWVALAFMAETHTLLPRRDEPALLVAFARSLVILFLTGYALLSGSSRERAIRESESAVRDLRRREEVLARALVALEEAQLARRAAEDELRLAQKLESLGRLAAGVAHEINTPVQFVSDSVEFVTSAIADLVHVIEAERRALASCRAGTLPSDKELGEVYAAEEEADVDYLLEALPKAIGRSTDGLERIANIVRSMKEFAHQERGTTSPADINRGIRSTLTVAASEYKYVASLETDLGELPLLNCNLGEINQVVLNLVVNAAHAIQDAKGGREKGTIRVASRRESDSVLISVSDDGCGIAPELRDRIFDPFFTTKEVGRGSGQGLALAQSIIQRHGGSIEVDSKVGQGSIFTIRLPVTA